MARSLPLAVLTRCRYLISAEIDPGIGRGKHLSNYAKYFVVNRSITSFIKTIDEGERPEDNPRSSISRVRTRTSSEYRPCS